MNRIRINILLLLLCIFIPGVAQNVSDGWNKNKTARLTKPVFVYNNWSAYDELSDNIPLDEALAMMSDKTRRIFIMSRYENKTYPEIAAYFSLSVKSVEFHISKALKILKVKLKDYMTIVLFMWNKSISEKMIFF